MNCSSAVRDVFAAELQYLMGGSERSRKMAYRLIRYCTSHKRLSLLKDSEGMRKIERTIRNFLVPWHITATFHEADKPRDITVRITTAQGVTMSVPYGRPRGKGINDVQEADQRRALTSRFTRGKAAG